MRRNLHLQSLSPAQQHEVYRGMRAGVDVSVYDSPQYDSQQMKQIRLGLESSLDVSKYMDSNISWIEMQDIREGMESHRN